MKKTRSLGVMPIFLPGRLIHWVKRYGDSAILFFFPLAVHLPAPNFHGIYKHINTITAKLIRSGGSSSLPEPIARVWEKTARKN